MPSRTWVPSTICASDSNSTTPSRGPIQASAGAGSSPRVSDSASAIATSRAPTTSSAATMCVVTIHGVRLLETTTEPSQPSKPTSRKAARLHQTTERRLDQKRRDATRVAKTSRPIATPINRLTYSVQVLRALKRVSP